MRFQTGLTSIYIEKSRVQQILIGFGWTIFNDDILQFCQLLSHLVMMFGECADLIISGSIAIYQRIHILKYRFLFVVHMLTHFPCIFIEEFEDQKSDVIL